MFEYKTERPDRPGLALQLAANLVYAQTMANINSLQTSTRKNLSKTVIEVAEDFLAWLDDQDSEEPEE